MMRIKVRDEIIEIPKYVIDKIPLIQTLDETKSEEMIELEEISPSFLKHVIHHVNNQQKPLNLKKRLDDEFEKDVIKKFLGYLGMNQLINAFYQPPEFIEDRRVVHSIHSDAGSYVVLLLQNEYMKINLDKVNKYICDISRDLIAETSSSFICEKRDHYGDFKKSVSKNDLVIDIHGIYMYAEKYIDSFIKGKKIYR
jgi:hypothetical protein